MMDLVAFVHRIHQGDLEQELKLEYSTEFVQLSKEMNAMAAGHNAPIVYDPATDHFSEFNGSGMSLGLVKGVAYQEQLFTDVQSGQVIMAFTDVQTVAA